MAGESSDIVKKLIKNGFSIDKVVFATLATVAALVGSTLSVWFVIEAKFVTTAVHAAANKKQNDSANCNQAKNNKAFLDIELNMANRELARLAYEAETRPLSQLERQRKIQLEQSVAKMIAEVAVLSKEVLDQCRLH